jgi:hypothetical protein
MMLSMAMNGFYGLKRLTGNLPADAPSGRGQIVHPNVQSAPFRLADLPTERSIARALEKNAFRGSV